MPNRIFRETRTVKTSATDKEAVVALLIRLEDEGYASLTLQSLRAAASELDMPSDLPALASLMNPQASTSDRTFSLGDLKERV